MDNEKTLFFGGNIDRYSSSIFEYSLENDQWKVLPLPQPDIGYWNLLELNNPAAGYPIAPSPNGTHIALEVISLQGPNPLNAVFVLSSNNKIKKISDDYVAHNPIWTSDLEP